MDAFIITMALSARAIQHGAHRHDRRRIYRCVLLLFRGRIEIDHSYGLRCRGLCCHSRHSTRGPAGAAAQQPAHSCCAGSGSTNHSSADRIVVNSYNSLWSSDAIWQQRSGSMLNQVKAWCCQALTEPKLTYNSERSSDIHLRVISPEIPLPSITKIILNHYLKFIQTSQDPMSYFIQKIRKCNIQKFNF